MSTATWQHALQLEGAVHVLAGGSLCPLYQLPAWACSTLHILTGICRTVTNGAFERFSGPTFSSDWEGVSRSGGIYRPWIAYRAWCPHHPEGAGHTYWSTAAASTLDENRGS